jgi:pimeloyl-ACP methyl ester carboxylesterase
MRTRVEKLVTAGDGTRLYARETRGPAARGTPIICANGIGVSTFFWRYLEEHFSRERPVIVWDYRGHGLSEYPRDLGDLSIEAMADDLGRVLDAYGHRRAVLAGHSMGCQVVYAFAHRQAERAAMLVPMLGATGRPVHTFLGRETGALIGFMIGHAVGTRMPDVIGRGQRRLLTHPLGRRVASQIARRGGLVHPTLMPQEDLELYLDHFAQFCPLVFFRMAEHMATHTAEPYLERIAAPTLVVAGTHDLFTPLHLSEEAADRIPTARLLVLEDGSHAALVEQPARIHAEIEAALLEWAIDPLPTASAPRVEVAAAG